MIEALVKRIFEIAVTEGHRLAEDAQDLLVELMIARDVELSHRPSSSTRSNGAS